MATATIQFACTQCSKKYSIPASMVGKTVACGCGAKLSVPSPQTTPVAVPPQPPQPQPFANPHSTGIPQNPIGTSPLTGGRSSALRREFPALKFVAKITDILSWLYVIGGVIAAIGVVIAAGAEAFPFSLLAGVAIGLLVVLISVFIRAGAEMIRLALYFAELLEDIRSNTP